MNQASVGIPLLLSGCLIAAIGLGHHLGAKRSDTRVEARPANRVVGRALMQAGLVMAGVGAGTLVAELL